MAHSVRTQLTGYRRHAHQLQFALDCLDVKARAVKHRSETSMRRKQSSNIRARRPEETIGYSRRNKQVLQYVKVQSRKRTTRYALLDP